jgi:hypothetical protein
MTKTNWYLLIYRHLLVKSIRVPSVAINARAHVISVDWRLLCQEFYFDELRCRRAEKPWLRYAHMDATKAYTSGRSNYPDHHSSWTKWHLLEDARGEAWLFWDQLPADDSSLL